MFSANSSQVSDDKLFVEDVFSTWLYTGNASTQTITNGIDLAGKGGMVWIKTRNSGSVWHNIYDTVRGTEKVIFTNESQPQYTFTNTLTAFNSNGFSIGSSVEVNGSGSTYASWTFREAPKFFDVVTYTGNGVGSREIAHNLGVAPGCIIIKRTDSAQDWVVYHRNNGTTGLTGFSLNTANAALSNVVGSDLPTATMFKPSAFFGSDINGANTNGATYVAYLYAHDATSDGVIQCGAAAAGTDINLGWEPQFVIIKRYDGDQAWFMNDNMRGMSVGGNTAADLSPNTSGAESTGSNNIFISSTGFKINLFGNYIYIAIRRGPMRTPTLGTSVFLPLATSLAVDTAITTNFPVDLMISGQRNSNNATDNWAFIDRLRGATASDNTNGAPQKRIRSTSNGAENSPTYPYAYNWWNTGLVQGYGLAGASQIYYTLRRAPGFFDEVCYTGTNSDQTLNHNLGVAPELVIAKSRTAALNWAVGAASLGFSANNGLTLNSNEAKGADSAVQNVTSTTVQLLSSQVQQSGHNCVAYLFASCPGVSKVGSYTGNGSSQTINCGFAAGARFVMIKRTDSTGDWYVWDTARGIVAGNDPHLSLNDLSAEVTTDDTIDTASSGFVVNQVAATNVNVSSATYIYLAIA